MLEAQIEWIARHTHVIHTRTPHSVMALCARAPRNPYESVARRLLVSHTTKYFVIDYTSVLDYLIVVRMKASL